MGQQSLTSSAEPTLHEKELIARVTWFIQLRWIAASGALATVFLAWFIFAVRFPVGPVLATILSIYLYNALFARSVQKRLSEGTSTFRLMRAYAIAQVVADLLSLTSLVHYLTTVSFCTMISEPRWSFAK